MGPFFPSIFPLFAQKRLILRLFFLWIFFLTILLSLTVVFLAERARLTMIDSRAAVFLEIRSPLLL